MKTKIIPAINAQSFEEIKEKIDILKDLVQNFHLDVAEKSFTGYETWQNYNDLDRLEKQLLFDLHLMISLKPQEILKWAKENVKRLILHLEASTNPDGLLKMTKKTKKEIFIAWSPNVEFDFIEKYLNFVQGVLILGVNPGKAGQKFLEETYQRIEFIKTKLKKNQKLMIDGGINKENFKKILSYHPDFIVMASAIYSTNQPYQTYLEFQSNI
jgi:ribulose-phosphate 3-epimerase